MAIPWPIEPARRWSPVWLPLAGCSIGMASLFLYAIPGQQDVTIYRQNRQAGKAAGQPQVAMKLPFAFPLISGSNAYGVSRDLSPIVYARPGGHADLYLPGHQ